MVGSIDEYMESSVKIWKPCSCAHLGVALKMVDSVGEQAAEDSDDGVYLAHVLLPLSTACKNI